MTYRLALDHPWPAAAQDVAAAVGWVRGNIGRYGGDPERIVVSGHSAGASHLASFLAGQGGGSLDGVRGGALSGIYDLAHRSDLERTYTGDAPAETVSTLPALLDCPVPLLFTVAERDTRYFRAQAADVVAAWLARHGVTPQLVWAEGHNHISEIASLGVDDALGTQLCRFIDRVTEPA